MVPKNVTDERYDCLAPPSAAQNGDSSGDPLDVATLARRPLTKKDKLDLDRLHVSARLSGGCLSFRHGCEMKTMSVRECKRAIREGGWCRRWAMEMDDGERPRDARARLWMRLRRRSTWQISDLMFNLEP